MKQQPFVVSTSTSSSSRETMSSMDIDPIDDGPTIGTTNRDEDMKKETGSISPASHGLNAKYPSTYNMSTATVTDQQQEICVVSITDEEARQCIEWLRSEDVAARVMAAHRIDAVALALGKERTRSELLPFITDGIDDEDEVLLAVATSLGRMVQGVGGAKYAHLLFRPIELLLAIEETTVRDAAVLSAQSILNELVDNEHMEQIDEFANMVSRLATKEWFTARISAAGLIASTYLRLRTPEQHASHLELFAHLCRDDTPMVRRVAARNLGTIVHNVVQVYGRESLGSNGAIASICLPLYEEIASQEQPDSVRLQTTENCVAFGQVMIEILQNDGPLIENELALLRRILPLIVATIDDRSWRVRWTAAAKFSNVVAAFEHLPGTMDTLIPAYEKLLQDPEAEVRTAATFNLARVAHCNSKAMVLPAQSQSGSNNGGVHHMAVASMAGASNNTQQSQLVSVAERLVKRVTSLTEDDSEHVRAALAMVATELAPVLGKDATITYLVPPVLLLLRDAAAEVRLNLILSLSALNKVIGVDLLSQSLLPAILDLSQDGKWRIRLAIIQHIPLLSEQLGREFFTERLTPLCVGWLGDDIASIRNAAANNLKELTNLFGSEWATENLLPPILEIREHQSYLRRLTALKACCMIATAMDSETSRLELLPIILDMATDVVPNIRFNVAKELRDVAAVCGPSVYERLILPILTMLLDDDDRDVRFYSEQTINSLDEEFGK